MALAELHTSVYNYLMKPEILDNDGQWIGGGHKSVIDSLIASGDLGYDHDAYGSADPLQPWSTGWVFKADSDGAPFRSVEGSGAGAICVMVYDSWSASTMWHSSSFPNVHIAIYGDASRDTLAFPGITTYKTPAEYVSGQDRALRIYEKIHPLFHDNANRIHKFDDLPVVSSVAGGGFSINPVPDGDGLVRLNQIYNVHL